jgi:urease subunit gamma/beta
VALICDAMFDAARAGSSYAAVEEAGRIAVRRDEVLPGVPALVGDVRLEVLMDDGTRLIVLIEPLGPPDEDAPGEIRLEGGSRGHAPGAGGTLELEVQNTSERVVRVSSHVPFDRVNRRLRFDRTAAVGHRLALPSGSTERWGPGETRRIRLVPFGGTSRPGGAT